jgi:hypothetical protein
VFLCKKTLQNLLQKNGAKIVAKKTKESQKWVVKIFIQEEECRKFCKTKERKKFMQVKNAENFVEYKGWPEKFAWSLKTKIRTTGRLS